MVDLCDDLDAGQVSLIRKIGNTFRLYGWRSLSTDVDNYWFLKDRAWVGVEYLHGRREVFSEQSGEADRLQFAVRFNLPS